MMRSTVWHFAMIILLAPLVAWGQEEGPQPQSTRDLTERGRSIFNKTCTGYCHGANGIAGAAPALAGRGFDARYVSRAVTYGVEGTEMQPWGSKLPPEDLRAVITFVEGLNRTVSTAEGMSSAAMSAQAARGRDLFFDLAEDLGRCSTCHQVNGRGIRVAPQITNVPADVSSLRALVSTRVLTATANGESFPALVRTQQKQDMKLYDLTTVPPVLRTFEVSMVKVTEGNSWRHASVLGNYLEDELGAILEFLRTMKER